MKDSELVVKFQLYDENVDISYFLIIFENEYMAKFEKKRIYRAIVKICISQTKSIWFICYDVCDSLKIFLLCSDIFIIDLQHNFGGQTKIPHCFFGRALSILSLRKLTSLADKELFRKKLIYAMEK